MPISRETIALYYTWKARRASTRRVWVQRLGANVKGLVWLRVTVDYAARVVEDDGEDGDDGGRRWRSAAGGAGKAGRGGRGRRPEKGADPDAAAHRLGPGTNRQRLQEPSRCAGPDDETWLGFMDMTARNALDSGLHYAKTGPKTEMSLWTWPRGRTSRAMSRWRTRRGLATSTVSCVSLHLLHLLYLPSMWAAARRRR